MRAAAEAGGYLAAVKEAAVALRPPTSKGGMTAAWVRKSMAAEYSGYAITAKPSANLYILLQVLQLHFTALLLSFLTVCSGSPS